jgi:two-component system phosphate regulon response regulator PhoB
MPKNPATTAAKRILVVEDEPALADIYQTRLAMDGFDVSVASDGISGFAAAIQTHPDLILLDVMLPGKDGFAVLQDLKLNLATEHIPVIILSNLGQDYEIVRGKKLGAARFLTKANLTPNQVSVQVKAVLAEAAEAPSP